MPDADLDNLRRHIVRLRAAIDRAKVEHPDGTNLPFIGRWPRNCCDAPFVFLLLYELDYRGMIRKCADVSRYGNGFEKHVWIVVDGITIDIAADQFPGVNDTAIVTRRSLWHEALPIIEERPWSIDDDVACYERYLRLPIYTVYERVLPLYANPSESGDGSGSISENHR